MFQNASIIYSLLVTLFSFSYARAENISCDPHTDTFTSTKTVVTNFEAEGFHQSTEEGCRIQTQQVVWNPLVQAMQANLATANAAAYQDISAQITADGVQHSANGDIYCGEDPQSLGTWSDWQWQETGGVCSTGVCTMNGQQRNYKNVDYVYVGATSSMSGGNWDGSSTWVAAEIKCTTKANCSVKCTANPTGNASLKFTQTYYYLNGYITPLPSGGVPPQ